MPLVDPDDNDSGSNGSEKSRQSNGDTGGKRLVADRPDDLPDIYDADSDMTPASPTRPLFDRGARPNPPKAVFPSELREIAESHPDRARKLLDAMEKNGEITELELRGASDDNPLMEQRQRENKTQLRERVKQLEKEVQALDDAVSTLVELHDEVPFSAECEECGGRMEFKQPFTGDNRLECENCGDTKPKGAGG